MRRLRTTATLLLLAAHAAPGAAQQKPTLTPDDYGRWETLGGATLAPDGRWIAYAIGRVDERNELRVAGLRRDTTYVFPFGTSPRFAANSRWLAWTVGASPEERDRADEDGERVRNGAGLLDLTSGSVREFESISELAFSADGAYLALRAYPPDEPDGKGADLQLLDLATGAVTPFGNVSELAWSESGATLAMTLATGSDAGNGVQAYDARTGRLRSLHSSSSTYRRLAWREGGDDLAVLQSLEPASDEGDANRVLVWRAVAGPARPLVLETSAIPDTLQIVEQRRLEWSDDGGRIAIGLRPRPVEADEDADEGSGDADDELPGLEIWHTRNVRLIPQEKAQRDRIEASSLLAVWDLEAGRVTTVGTDLWSSARVLEGWRTGVEDRADDYAWGTMFGRRYHDVWTVDLQTGARAKTLERVRYAWESAGGRYLLWFDGEGYWTHDLRTGARRNLTAGLATSFADTASDTPTDLLPPHGVGGWVEGDRWVYLYDRFDVWRVAPDGSGGERVTAGAEEEIVHRIARVDRDEAWLAADRPLYFSLRGEATEKRGYARMLPGRRVERLTYEDALVGSLARADSADVYVFRSERFDDSPDLFVAGGDLRSPRRVSDTNPFQGEFAWGHSEIFDFESDAGVPLQAAIIYPAQYDPARRYPMIVYTYEILAPNVHRYVVPSERSYYNYQAWSQAGYFVLLPDIVYRWRDPGMSALDAVRPAVAATVDRGLVDEDRVGLIGHSWGGYQATFLPTRTDIFAASVAGAPITDFVSFMGALHWSQGIAELDHWETGQARMEVPYWEDPVAHERNSPIHKVQDLHTPLLMAFGNEDGTVDWDQGTEFFNFARRAGKQMVLLVYDGEDHGFRKKAVQIDYHRRILEWFGHYLKGEPAPSWITDPIPAADQDAELRRVQKGVKRPIG